MNLQRRIKLISVLVLFFIGSCEPIAEEVVLPPAPVPSFTSNITETSTFRSIQFTGDGSNSPTSYYWTFEGGTPSTSSAKNPLVSYSAGGTFDVTLTVENEGGRNTITKQNFIVVRRVLSSNEFAKMQTQTNKHFITYKSGMWDVGINLQGISDINNCYMFKFQKYTDGTFKIIGFSATSNGTLVAWSSATIGSGAPIRLYNPIPSNVLNRPYWYIVPYGTNTGTYTIQNQQNGTYLTWGSTVNLIMQYSTAAISTNEAVWKFYDSDGMPVDMF